MNTEPTKISTNMDGMGYLYGMLNGKRIDVLVPKRKRPREAPDHSDWGGSQYHVFINGEHQSSHKDWFEVMMKYEVE
jgi:hypothetical protein